MKKEINSVIVLAFSAMGSVQFFIGADISAAIGWHLAAIYAFVYYDLKRKAHEL